MMSAKTFFIIFTLSLFSNLHLLHAQSESDRSKRLEISRSAEPTIKNDSLSWPKHKVTVTPFSFFSFYHPRIEFGYERLHSHRFATHYGLSWLTNRDNEYARNSKGYKLAFEAKYFRPDRKNSRWYYAIAFEYLAKRHDAQLYYTTVPYEDYQDLNRQDYFFRMVEVDKSFFTMSLRVGAQQYIGPHLVFEGYAGVGIRRREVKHLNAGGIVGHHRDRDYISWDLEYGSNRIASERLIQFDLNLRLAWTF